MRHCSPIVVLVISLVAAAITPPAAAAPPDLMVSERAMQRHLEELGITGEAANNVRAAWGRMKFNLERLEEVSEMLAAWRDTGGILMNFFPRDEGELRDAYMRFNEIAQPSRRAHGKWEQLLPLVVVERYFTELEVSAASQRAVAAALRRAHLRARLPRRPAGHLPYGLSESVDLVVLLDQLAEEHPELAPDFENPAPAVQDLLSEYDQALTELVVDRYLRMVEERATTRPERPDRPELAERWVDAYLDYRVRARVPLLQIRILNSRTAVDIASLMPDPAGKVFRHEANLKISPFAFDSPSVRRSKIWIDRSITSGDLDETKRTALAELKRTIESQREPLARRTVAAYDASYSIESERSFWESHARISLGETTHLERPFEAEYKLAQEALDGFDADAWERVIRLLGDDRRLFQGRIQPYEDLGQTAEEVAAKEARIQESMDRWQPRQFAPFLGGAEFRAVAERMPFTDDSRRAIFETMYSDFSRAFAEAATAHEEWAEEKLAEARAKDEADPQHGGHLYQQSFAGNARWLKQRVALEEDFENAVRLFVNDEERAIWEREVRAARKRRILPYALHQFHADRERYVHDLTDVLREKGLYENDDANLASAIAAYEVAFDDALKRYERQWDATAAEFAALNQVRRQTDAPRDHEAADKKWAEVHAIRDGILEARLNHVDGIIAALAPDQQAAFRAALDAADFPELFTPTPVNYLAIAFERDNQLDDDQREIVSRLISQYRPVHATYRADLIKVIRRHDFSENKEQHDEIGQRVFRRMGEREQLVMGTCQSIRSLFTQAEIDEMAADIRLLLTPVER